MTYDCRIPPDKRKILMGYYEDNEGVNAVLQSRDLVDFLHLSPKTVARKELRILAGDRCQVCGRRKGKIVVHHIKPKEWGRDDSPANLIYLCRICHDEAHDWLKEFSKRRGEPSHGLSPNELKSAQQNYV
jgi:hypothetical protein